MPDLEARQSFMKRFYANNGTPEEYEAALARGDQFHDFRFSFGASYFFGRLYPEIIAAGIEDRTEEIE